MLSFDKDVLTTGEVAKICNVAPRTVSSVGIKVALAGYSRAAYYGVTRVEETAKGADAVQEDEEGRMRLVAWDVVTQFPETGSLEIARHLASDVGVSPSPSIATSTESPTP